MNTVTLDVAVGQLLAVLREAFEGSDQGWTYFTDSGRESAIFGSLEGLSAAEASHPWGGTSVAAHAHHILFSLEASAAWTSGDRSPRNWPESWRVSTVDDAEWRQMQEQIRARYQTLRQAFESSAAVDEEAFGAAVGAVAHMAYHLGAIRQKLAFSKGQ
jgi:hypothetical protein